MITRLSPTSPSGPFGGVAEGLAGDRDAVDPRLQLAREREIVHRRADDDGVGGEEFVEHVFVGEGGESEVRNRVGGEVAVDHLRARIRPTQLPDDGRGDWRG